MSRSQSRGDSKKRGARMAGLEIGIKNLHVNQYGKPTRNLMGNYTDSVHQSNLAVFAEWRMLDTTVSPRHQ